jgi:hypothetical protein
MTGFRLMSASPALTVLAAGILAVMTACCAAGRPASEAIGARFGNSDAEDIDGFYAICSGAYAHRETLVLRAGGFEHFIHTHGMYGSRSVGSYALVGDTITLQIEQTRPAPEADERPMPPEYDLVIGEIGGRRVLWRGRQAARQNASGTVEISVYAALFFAGPDSADRAVPSCSDVRRRRIDREAR